MLFDDGLCAAYRTTPVNGEPAELWLLKEEFRGAPEFASMFADGCAFLARFALPSLARVAEASAHAAVVVAPPWVSLEALVREGGVPIGLAVTVLGELARDLARLPGDVAIRSFSTDALAITTAGRPRILSPVLARFPDRSTTTRPGVIKGTLRYLSPEIIRGEPAGNASDVFALGLVIHELLCGEHPIDGDTDFDVLAQLRDARIPTLASRRPDLPIALTSAVDRMLAASPDDRVAPGELAGWIEDRLAAHLWPGERVFAEVTALAPEAAKAAIVYGL